MEIAHRPAVRVVCLDAAGRLLLLRWRDPFDGVLLWEPPGGGIEAGETPLAAARRELVEETGLDPAAIVDQFVVVERDVGWNGKRYLGPEQFFVARFGQERPVLLRTGLLADEQVNLCGHAWVAMSDGSVGVLGSHLYESLGPMPQRPFACVRELGTHRPSVGRVGLPLSIRAHAGYPGGRI